MNWYSYFELLGRSVLLLLFVFQNQVIAHVKKIKHPKRRLLLRYVFNGLKAKFTGWKSIILPAFSAIVLTLLISLIFRVPLTLYKAPLLRDLFLFTVIFSPVSEEVLWRALLLSALISPQISEKLGLANDGRLKYILALLAVSLLFTLSHSNPTLYQSVSRFFASMLYGTVYIVSGRNLLPAIVAHAADNLFINFFY